MILDLIYNGAGDKIDKKSLGSAQRFIKNFRFAIKDRQKNWGDFLSTLSAVRGIKTSLDPSAAAT